MKSGDRIGNWTLQKQLGRGMIASTWLAIGANADSPGTTNSSGATDSSGTAKPSGTADSSGAAKPSGAASLAVLKILDLQEMGDWAVADLFRREAEALKVLDHPGIPAFIESFEAKSDGKLQLVLAMQYMEGETLEAVVASGRRFSEDEVVSILAGLADILTYLASLRPQVIHRDVNPRNILLSKGNTVSIVDFSGARDAVRSALYPGATLVGTAGYTAAEQVAGRASTRSDLYGAAATAVFLLTGLNPSELPVRDMKIDLSGLVELSPGLAAVLDSWLEGDQTKRNLAPSEAAAILRGLRPPPSRSPKPEEVEKDRFTALEDRLMRALLRQDAGGNSLVSSIREGIQRARSEDGMDEGLENPPLPADSKVRIERNEGSLVITIPPGRRNAASASLGIFSVAWLSFVAFWTAMTVAMGAPIFFPLFSIPFWAVGIAMARATIKSMAGTGVLTIRSGFLEYTEQLFGTRKTRNWPLVDIGKCRIVPAHFQVQGTNHSELLLEAGTNHSELLVEAGATSLRIGSGLSHRELSALKSIIESSIRDFSL